MNPVASLGFAVVIFVVTALPVQLARSRGAIYLALAASGILALAGFGVPVVVHITFDTLDLVLVMIALLLAATSLLIGALIRLYVLGRSPETRRRTTVLLLAIGLVVIVAGQLWFGTGLG